LARATPEIDEEEEASSAEQKSPNETQNIIEVSSKKEQSSCRMTPETDLLGRA
jgi:hypothetical protein